MTRTHSTASALAAVFAISTLAACGGGPRPSARPAPTLPEPVAEQPAPEPETIGETFAIEAAAAPVPVSRGLLGTAEYDLPVVANQWVEMELSFLVNQRRDVIGRWMQRADRYEEWVRGVLASHGVPRDLHHLAMVESGYQPTVRSRAGAVGMWQFMPATGRGMGLRIDDVVDERMDPVRSTHAAARHLRELHRDFGGDWALAAAAYNAGGGRISRGMARFGVRNFWDLAERGDLAQETRHYVPRLFAITIIAKDRARFGYPPASGLVRGFRFDSLRVDVMTPLAELARIASVPVDQLAELNPHLYRGVAPANYWVWVPDGQGAAIQTAFQGSDFRKRGGYAFYTLRRGEDLESVAAAAGLTVAQLRDLNLSSNVDRVGRGDRIRLWADAARALASRPASSRTASRDDDEEKGERRPRVLGEDRVASSSGSESSASESRSFESRSSESRSSESRSERRASASRSTESRSSEARSTESRESRTSESRRSASREEGSARVASRDADGERSERAKSSESRRSSSDGESSSARRSESSSRRGSESGESSRGSRSASSSRSHTVEDGETLWGIARRYDLTVVQVREANELGESAQIQPGQKLRIPRASSSASSSASTRVASRDEERPAARRSSESERSTSRGESRGTGRRGVAEHTVKSGETLWSIARTYESSVEAIRDANDMDADSVLQPGQKLRVPRPASSGARD